MCHGKDESKKRTIFEIPTVWIASIKAKLYRYKVTSNIAYESSKGLSKNHFQV